MSTKHPVTSTATSTVTVIAGVVLAAVVAALVNLGVAALARSVVTVTDFGPLTPATYLSFTVLGVIAGAVGWAVVRHRARRPAELLRWLVPTAVAVSFVPDVVLLFASPAGVVPVVALMVMHLVVAAVAVPVYGRVLPVESRLSMR